jgi:FemAB-related protein (PEP-CTERM system-associated)
MRIVVADSTRSQAWDAFVAGQAGAAPYHAWAWLEAVRRAYGFQVFPLLALRDGAVAGLLPLVRLRLPGLRGRLVSLPYCDRAGPLAAEADVRQGLLDQALDLAAGLGAAGLETREAAADAGTSAKVLMRLALPDGAERLMASFPAKLRSQIRKPSRDGLRARTGGLELLEPFYQVFSRNMRDLGSPTHSLAWFGAVVAGFGPKARVTVVFMPDGTPAAGAVTLVQGRTVHVPWASSLKRHNRHSPNMLLYWTLLSRAADEGRDACDMGRSTPGEGTYRFKEQWGAREAGLSWQRFDAATRQRRPALAAGGPGRPRKLLAACWRRLPVGLANDMGTLLRRYISL